MLNYSTDETNDRVWGMTLTAWVQIVLVAVLMVALFRFNLARLWSKTNPINGQDSNWQHAIFVPLIGLYYLYIHRDELQRAAVAPRRQERGIRWLAFAGLALMGVLGAALFATGETGTPLMMVGMMATGMAVAAAVPTATSLGTVTLVQGLLVFAYGIWPGQNDYVKDLGMVITLFGVVTLLCGWQVMKVAWFPIVFLVVALPWPELVYAKLAWPLQKLAASVAVVTLRTFGVVAQNTGTKIQMVNGEGTIRVLNVAEACAGLKSVMTFVTVGATLAFFAQRALWEKLVITAAAVPTAIFCNVVRVSGQGLLDRYVSHEWSEGFAHQFAGLIMVIPGFFLIMLVGWILEKLFIEEVERGRRAAPATEGKAAFRSKRIIVEVPRKKESGEGGVAAAVTEKILDAVAPAVAVPAVAAAPAPEVVKPAAAPAVRTVPANKTSVPAKPQAVAGAGSKAVAPAKPQAVKPAVAPPAAPAKTVTPPPTGLKPAAPRTPPRPGLPPQGLKPSAPSAAGAPAQRPATSPGSNVSSKPAGAQPPAVNKPPANKPSSSPKPPPPPPPQGGRSE